MALLSCEEDDAIQDIFFLLADGSWAFDSLPEVLGPSSLYILSQPSATEQLWLRGEP
jgi:hypothetical protein